MRITKRQLRGIIREERARLLGEEYPLGGGTGPASWQEFERATWDAAAEMTEAGAEIGNVRLAMLDAVKDIFSDMVEELDLVGH